MTAASRIEALAASCGSSKKTHKFLRMAGEHKMAPAEAEALFERTMQPTLPSYMNTTLSSIANTKESAEIRDALRFAQSLAAFKAALEKHQHLSQYSRSEHWTRFDPAIPVRPVQQPNHRKYTKYRTCKPLDQFCNRRRLCPPTTAYLEYREQATTYPTVPKLTTGTPTLRHSAASTRVRDAKQRDHRIRRDCPFRNFYDPTQELASPTGQQKASPASSSTTKTPSATETPPVSYAHRRLLALKKRKKVAYPLRSHGFQKKPAPLALYSETLTSSEDVIDATPIAESTTSPNGTGESKPV
ncbi:hypothetical protein N7465_000753 [Penicillium sp. CMV-2018d]|nr:hypothetical protein N7465_000753 [Penicillium sp. CMV-2018d]